MLSMGSILLHLIVDPFKTCFSQHGTDTLAPVKCIYVPLWLGALSVIRWFCCGCCFVVFVALTGGSEFVPFFVVQCFVPFLVLRSS